MTKEQWASLKEGDIIKYNINPKIIYTVIKPCTLEEFRVHDGNSSWRAEESGFFSYWCRSNQDDKTDHVANADGNGEYWDIVYSYKEVLRQPRFNLIDE